MKTKSSLILSPVSRQLWSKKTKERTNVNYILIAELSNQSETFFASNVNSDLEKHFGPNSNQRLQEIIIKGKKSNESSYLQLLLSDNRNITLYEENFTLLVSCSYYDESGNLCLGERTINDDSRKRKDTKRAQKAPDNQKPRLCNPYPDKKSDKRD